MDRPLLSLVGIFKDEADNIRRVLESAKPWAEQAMILDTGSSDETVQIATEVFGGENNKLTYSVACRNFVDFAVSRNEALQMEEERLFRAVFTLMLSGDEVLEGGDILRKFLADHVNDTDGAYFIEIVQESQAWPYPRVLRVDSKWRYKNRVQEVPVGPNGEHTGPFIPGVRIVHTCTDAARREKRIREFDVPILSEDAENATLPIEDRLQAMFHLADMQTAIAASMTPNDPLNDYLSRQMAAMALYWRVGQIAGEQVVGKAEGEALDFTLASFALFRYFNIAQKVGFYSPDELALRIERLAENAPHIAEVRYMLAVQVAQMDSRKGLLLAQQAAEVARQQRVNPKTHMPQDLRVEWMSLRLAAACAQRAGLKKSRVQQIARLAVEAGGSEDELQEWL